MEGCFERIICFETLNSSDLDTASEDGSESDSKSSVSSDLRSDVDVDNAPPPLPVTPILCKPSPQAFESALKIANIDPQRTVRNFLNVKLEKERKDDMIWCLVC